MCVISALNACLGAVWVEYVPTFCSVDNHAHPIVIVRSIAALLAAVRDSALTILFAKETKMMETLVQLTRSVCLLFAIRRVFVQVGQYMRLRLNGRCLFWFLLVCLWCSHAFSSGNTAGACSESNKIIIESLQVAVLQIKLFLCYTMTTRVQIHKLESIACFCQIKVSHCYYLTRQIWLTTMQKWQLIVWGSNKDSNFLRYVGKIAGDWITFRRLTRLEKCTQFNP